ncbi:MAG TPA: histidine phosphatase family protein [Herpetosiphonaceae bacterium]
MHNATFPITRLLLVRHGETDANVAGRMQGRGNDPLTERGQQQARAVAARLKAEDHSIEALYSSSLLRASQTADAIGAALGLTPRLRDALQEMHLGDLDGTDNLTLDAAMPQTLDESYPNGESIREFVERTMGAFYGIAMAHPGSTVVIVSHGGVISTALSIWSHGHGNAWRDYVPANCAISTVEFQAGPQVLHVNDCAHIAGE